MAAVESSSAIEFPDSECDTDAPSGSDQLLLPSILLLLFSFILATAAANQTLTGYEAVIIIFIGHYYIIYQYDSYASKYMTTTCACVCVLRESY